MSGKLGPYKPMYYAGDTVIYEEGDMFIAGLVTEEVTVVNKSSNGWDKREATGVYLRPLYVPLKPEPVFVPVAAIQQVYKGR